MGISSQIAKEQPRPVTSLVEDGALTAFEGITTAIYHLRGTVRIYDS